MLVPLIVLLHASVISASLRCFGQPSCQLQGQLLRDGSQARWQYEPGMPDACYWNLTFSELTDVESLRTFECVGAPGFDDFRRIEVEAARQCLRNKHIVLIGDSHTRFQFDALIVFLETGKHQSPLLRSFGNRLSLMMPPLDAAGQSAVMRQEFYMAYNYPNGTYKNGTHACQKYYHNPALGLTVSLLGLYGFSYGHGPVGWPDGMASHVPFGAKAWGPGGPQELVSVISQHFGQVDEIVINVGQWKYWPSPRTGEWIKKYRSSTARPVTDEAISAIMDKLKHFSPLVKKV